MKKILLFIAVSLCAMMSQAKQAENRVALVIGNSTYKTSPLKNPVNDAVDMSARLKGFGFTVIERNNLTTKQIGSTLREFRSKLTLGSVALVFYAGHGVTIKGKNYLPAVDAEINGEEDVPNQSLSTEQIMDVLAESKTRLNLVFLDACRDNPYARSFRSTSRGLSRESAPSGTLISFATKPGSVASDGTGRNGLYTSVLLEQLNNSNQPIEQVLKKVVSGVRVASKNQQEPWMEGSIEGDFCFGGCGQTAFSQVPAELTESQKEEIFWSDTKATGNSKAFEAYIKQYPIGRYVDLAKANVARLTQNNSPNVNSSTSDMASGKQKEKEKEDLNRENVKRQEDIKRKEEALAKENENRTTIAVSIFRGEENSPQKITQIVAADLERSGQFLSFSLGAVIDEDSRPDFAPIRKKTADVVLTGSVSRLADGRFDIRFRLWDALKGQDMGGQSFVVLPSEIRLVSHRIANQIYEKFTGHKGIFATRIAFITNQGGKHVLWVADSDGENPQAALSSQEPIISPSWSPSGNELTYVSFESRKPVVYIHDIATGKRRVLANFKGSNSAPAWSHDGEKLAIVLSRDDDNSQIYIIGKDGGEPLKLMVSQSIDTEPVFSSDGKYIYFVSDRSGSPQIYRIPAIGGPVQRITFIGNHNTSPSISPDGKLLTYISRVAGTYKLHVMDLSNDKVTALTASYADKKPTFAPNGKAILYSTVSQGSEVLMTTTLDGKTSSRLANQFSKIREPSWGPFLYP